MTGYRSSGAVLFDDALKRAASLVERAFPYIEAGPVLVRDVYGRVRVAVDDRQRSFDAARLSAFAAEFHKELAAYSPGEDESDVFLLGSRLWAPDELFASPDIFPLLDRPKIGLLERQVTGQDWIRFPIQTKASARRATLYGVKGGVGRSTALAIWAKHLAEVEGKKVLVVDLDLESPGISSILLPRERSPDYGLVDYLIEEGVGQGAEVLPALSAISPLCDGSRGEIVVVPAHGAESGDYLAKLSRIYQGVPDGPSDFAERIAQAIAQLEETIGPDVVLFDSRAGLHDIAAMTVTRLQALALLFAVNTPQTLAAYRLLFDSFRRHPTQLVKFRDNLQSVAALAPPTQRTDYLRSLKTGLFDLFASSVYEEDSDEPEVFNYSLDEEDAPHNPLQINWYQWFLDFDPIGNPEALRKDEVQAAFGDFTERATKLLLGARA